MDETRFSVTYEFAGVGWIYLTLAAPGLSLTIPASNVFDPFPELIEWLESIASGSRVNEMIINMEGGYIRLSYSRIECDGVYKPAEDGILTLANPYDQTIIAQAHVQRGDLVREFTRVFAP
jgi:hypothetical protein